MQRCRHYHTWLLAAGSHEWCYQCGAMRKMITMAPNYVFPQTRWMRPTGKDGENPWPMTELKRK